MNSVVSHEQEKITIEIVEAERRRDILVKELDLVDAELESMGSQISIYTHLSEVSEKLEQLHELGGGELFWEDKYTNENDLIDHLHGLRTKAKKFNDQIDVIRNRKLELE